MTYLSQLPYDTDNPDNALLALHAMGNVGPDASADVDALLIKLEETRVSDSICWEVFDIASALGLQGAMFPLNGLVDIDAPCRIDGIPCRALIGETLLLLVAIPA